MKKYITLFLLIALLYSCNEKKEEYNSQSPSMSEMSLKASPDENNNDDISTSDDIQLEKKLIRNANISLKTADIDKGKSEVEKILKELNGYLSSENFYKNDYSSEYQLLIRLPANNFDDFILKLEKIDGIITNKNISVDDVTNQYHDYKMRLENKNIYLEKYKEMLKQAHSIGDILEIQEKIRILEEEIESTTGQLKYLSNQVTLSTINLNLYKETTPTSNLSILERIGQSLDSGWSAFIEFTYIIIALWPFIIFGILIYIVFITIRKKKRKVN